MSPECENGCGDDAETGGLCGTCFEQEEQDKTRLMILNELDTAKELVGLGQYALASSTLSDAINDLAKMRRPA